MNLHTAPYTQAASCSAGSWCCGRAARTLGPAGRRPVAPAAAWHCSGIAVLADAGAAAAADAVDAAASLSGQGQQAVDACSGLGCAQDVLDAAARPFAALADSLPAGSLLPGVAALGAATGVAAWRLAVYSRREYIVAAMMRKYVPKGGARVLQVNGTTRDVFYYPDDAVSVQVVGSGIRPGLMEQAGASAGVPVRARQQSPTDLSFQGTGSLDAVVAFNALASVGEGGEEAYFAEVARVLKPGAPFVFVDRVKGEGLAAAVQPLVGSIFDRIDEAALQKLRRADNLENVSGDIALANEDPHAVGVAFRAGGPLGGNAEQGSNRRLGGSGSDRPSQRKSKRGGSGKKKGFATSGRR